MRLAGLIAALAFGLAAPGTGFAQPATQAALGPGEILLEVDAVGKVKRPADLARIYVSAKSKAETAAKARAANAALIGRLTAAANSAGVAPGDVRPTARGWRVGFIGNEIPGAAVPGAMGPAEKTEASMLDILIRDPARVEAVRTALEQAGADQVTDPAYELEEDSAARRDAKQDAVRRARAEADDYARALGMRVVRILRVSERVAPYPNPDDMETLYLAMGLGSGSANEVETTVKIAVDFALAQDR